MVVGFLYFQLSTFTLVQWVREHAREHADEAKGYLFDARGGAAQQQPRVSADQVADGQRAAPTPPVHPSPPPPPPPCAAPSPPPLSGAGTAGAATQSHSKAHRAPAEEVAGAIDDLEDDPDAGGLDDSAVPAQMGEGIEGLDSDASLPAAATSQHASAGAAEADVGGAGTFRTTRLASWIDSDSYGRFIGITTFFNPGRHQNKVDNFRKARSSVAAQGLQMLCVELVFDDEPFQLRGPDDDAAEVGGDGSDGALLDADSSRFVQRALLDADEAADASSKGGGDTGGGGGGGGGGHSQQKQRQSADCDILIHRRTSAGNTLWQKERLLNIALENLPNSVEKVMWLDSDLIFLNDDWVVETSELLDHFPVVQPFGWMTYLSANQDGSDLLETLGSLPLGQGVGAVYHSAGLGVQSFPDMCFRSNFLLGHPGFAWAARREVMVNGFYDRSIIGGGDRIMLNGFTGHYVGVSRKMPKAMEEDVRAFGRKLTLLAGPTNVSYAPGVVVHIWHGNRADRDYTNRYHILLHNNYDPVHDVRINEAGVLEWASAKPKLHKMVNEYFSNRKEGPTPNQTKEGSKEGGEDDEEVALAASRRSMSRPVRSYLGYHCRRPDYRASCKMAFRLWGDTLRAALLQLLNKKLRAEEQAAKEALTARREAAQNRTRGKRKQMRERKQKRRGGEKGGG